MEAQTILQQLEQWCPNVAPTSELSPFELGIIVGQRRLIELLKYSLNVDKPEEGLERK
jgi:hypothetical protein